MTRIERLLRASAGGEAALPVGLIVTDDWTTPALLAPLEALGTRRAAAPVVLVRDHTMALESYQGEERERVARLREVEESFVERFEAQRLVGRGIQHHVLPASGLLRPGMLILGNDSHTPTLGAYGVAAFAAQPTTIAAAIHTGTFVIRVPETLQVRVVGRLASGASARDAALNLLDRLRAGGPVPRLATGKALEFSGPGLATLSIAERAVLANATPEAAAVTTTFPVDRVALAALGTVAVDAADAVEVAEEGLRQALEPVAEEVSDSHDYLVLDLSEVRPSLALSGQPADVVRLADLAPILVDRVFVGTCAGGTYEEISDFAEALGERAIVPTVVAPASLEVESRLRERGVLGRLETAGVTLLPPGCGPCFGFGVGRLAAGEVAVVTGNRNGIGRMGSPSASIHLASGRTAGEAARTGRLGRVQATWVQADEPHASPERPQVLWPGRGNVIRLIGTVSTDDLTPSSVPGVGTSSDADPRVVRRLLLHHLDPSSATRNLQGTVIVADENFGLGSNRASSVRALKLAGVYAVVARSVAPLYALGARDEGLLVIQLDEQEFYELAGPDSIIEVDEECGHVLVEGRRFPIPVASPYEIALREAGGVVHYLLARGVERTEAAAPQGGS